MYAIRSYYVGLVDPERRAAAAGVDEAARPRRLVTAVLGAAQAVITHHRRPAPADALECGSLLVFWSRPACWTLRISGS